MKTLIKKSTGEYLSFNYITGDFYECKMPTVLSDTFRLYSLKNTFDKTEEPDDLDFTDVELIEVFVIKESDLPNSSDIARAGIVFADKNDNIQKLSNNDLIRSGYVNGFKDAIKLITKNQF
jgi:hypothetical protein